MTNTGDPLGPQAKTLSERLTFWIGVLGSLVTIILTVWNAHTKNEIDQREENLRALEVQMKERATGVEESKERVDRYKWVLSLLPSLTEKDATKRNFTVALVRLALTKNEAEQLFSGLQLSSSQELREVGQKGFEAVENQELNQLILQMNANSADQRKAAVARLEKNYSSSSSAISLVLDQYSPERVSALSPSGLINGLYFLSATDPQAWTPKSKNTAREVISRISGNGIGPQTKAAVDKLNKVLATPEGPK